MADKNQKDVEITDKEKGMENNKVDEKMEGKEGKEGEKEEHEVKEEVHEKKESTFDRFLGWFRGKQKTQEEEVKEKEDEEEKEEEDKEEEEKENKKGNKLKENEGANEFENKKEVNEKEGESKKDIKTLKTTSTVVETKEGQQVTVDRTLLIIEEEGKSDNKVAPLAQAEDEDIEEAASDSRQSIDWPVIEPRSAVAVESEKETTKKEALSQDDVDASKKEKRKSATVFLKLSQPSFERHSEEIDTRKQDKRTTEHDKHVKDKTKLVDAQQAVPKHNKQKSKMEEEIIEKRHEDRTESMKETWKRVEELDPNKTYRVSYTVTTTTIQKSGKPEDKADDDDEEEERLFGDLLPSSDVPKKTYDGPPPEDLEPEYTYEEAKKDEAGTADIDKIFEMMAKDAPPPEDGDTVETIRRKERGSQEILETPEDIFRKLHNWDKEPTDWWTSTKKKRDYEEWIKPMKEGTIRRVIIPKVEIPYDACVRFVTDWKYREEWDKTFSEIKILRDSKDSKLIYCPVKKRDLAFETLDRMENDPPSYIMTWKRQMVDKEGQEIEPSAENKKQLQLITRTCGFILRPSESGEQATYITILCQLEGEVDKALKNTFLAGHPKSWLRNLKKYYKKQQKGAQKKVVYL